MKTLWFLTLAWNVIVVPAIVTSTLALELEVVRQFTPEASGLQELASGNPKVAFLFLIMQDFPWAEVWDAFFHNATEGTYSIYIHRAALKDDADRKANELPLAKYGAIDVPWVKSAWCGLFGVEVATLFAAMQDPSNVQFVFVSESSLPLKPYGYVYNELVRNSPQTSKLCLASPAFFKNGNVEFSKQEATRSCYYRDFFRKVNPRAIKHHQWGVFTRPHAKLIVQYAEEALRIYEDVWMKASPEFVNAAEGCSDEAVPLIALLHALDAENKSTGNTWMDLSRLGVEQNCLTYVRWRNCFVGTDLVLSDPLADLGVLWNNLDELLNLNTIDLTTSALRRELNGFPHIFANITEDYLEKMVAQNFLFARKFHPGARVVPSESISDWRTWLSGRRNVSSRPLAEVLPQLWLQLNWHKARTSQWRRLEFSGRPRPLDIEVG